MSVKKDIAATVIFLVTSLLFAVVQMEGREDAPMTDHPDCLVSKTVIQVDQVPTLPSREPLSRDS